MDLEDLGTRYREVNLWKRLVFLSVVAIVSGAYDFWDRYETLVAERKAAQDEKVVQENKLKYALDKHQKLARLEEQLLLLENQMKDVSRKFPDEIPMDKVLQKTELLTQELGVSLKSFHPKQEIPSETAFKYLKLPIGLQLVGTFGQIMNFFDHVVHLNFLVNIENIDLSVDNPSDADKLQTMSDEKKRSQMRLRASCDMSVFRSLNEKEAKAMQVLYENKRAAEEALKKAQNPTSVVDRALQVDAPASDK